MAMKPSAATWSATPRTQVESPKISWTTTTTGAGRGAQRFAWWDWWQDRKRVWIGLGIRSEEGRGGNLLRFSDTLIEPDPEKRAARKAAA